MKEQSKVNYFLFSLDTKKNAMTHSHHVLHTSRGRPPASLDKDARLEAPAAMGSLPAVPKEFDRLAANEAIAVEDVMLSPVRDVQKC